MPVGLEASAEACGAPCDRIVPNVTLTWAASEAGASASGYRVLRDGAPLGADLDATQLTFVDETVTLGQSYGYQVVATSDDGDSPPSTAATATVPTPPDDTAHLDGVYRVELTVRSANQIGAAFGIEDPLPGKRDVDRWSFESTCADDEGACPSEWSKLEGLIVQDGPRWQGTVQGLPAKCGRDGRTPAPIEVDLKAVDLGVVDAAWKVTSFRGSATVSFRCPGFPSASATVEVTGSL
jgi:hypothetical protein